MASATPIEELAIIDVDAHITEPHDLWTSRAPAAYRDRVPRVEEVDGERAWMVDGNVQLSSAIASSVVGLDGTKSRGVEFFTWQIEDVHVASYDMQARLELLDGFGIHAQLIYPNVAGFGNQNFMKVEDRDLRRACATIYNDAMAEIQADTGERILPMALVPWWNIEDSVAEVERASEMGLRGIVMCSDPDSIGLPDLADEAWLPFWEVCADKQMPVNFHIGGGGPMGNTWDGMSAGSWIASMSMMAGMGNMRCLVNLLFSGVLDRFPALDFVLVESGAGWLPFMLKYADYQADENGVTDLELKPSEYFRRQVYASYWFEESIAPVLDALGEDNLMFETDFPHPTCLYPAVREKIQDSLAGIDPRVQRKVLYETAARLYGIDSSLLGA